MRSSRTHILLSHASKAARRKTMKSWGETQRSRSQHGERGAFSRLKRPKAPPLPAKGAGRWKARKRRATQSGATISFQDEPECILEIPAGLSKRLALGVDPGNLLHPGDIPVALLLDHGGKFSGHCPILARLSGGSGTTAMRGPGAEAEFGVARPDPGGLACNPSSVAFNQIWLMLE